MDKLKKNGFALGLGGLGLVALFLLYFLVIRNMWGGQSGLGAAWQELGQIETKYKKYADPKRTPVVPSKNSQQAFDQSAKKWEEILEEARRFYASRKLKFDEIHPEYTGIEVVEFKAFYETWIDKHKREYREKFLKEPAAPTAPEASGGNAPTSAASPSPLAARGSRDAVKEVPEVEDYPKFTDDGDIGPAMKELWIIEEVFKALTELGLGGLQAIRFPERRAVQEAGAQYRWVRSRVMIEMPLLKLEPLLNRLFQSEQVPFQLHSLTVSRPPGSTVTKMVEVKKYKSPEEAEAESVDAIRAEPPAAVQLDLSALDYLGVPPEGEKASR